MVRLAEQDVQRDLVGRLLPLAPSTRAIIRSMKVSPGFAVIWTTMRSESTLVPPVTELAVAAGLADHRRGLAGDRRLVDAGDALDDVAVAGDGLRRPPPRPGRRCGARWLGTSSRRCRPRPSRWATVVGAGCACAACRLGLAAALGDGLGEVGEHHGEPEPDRDGPAEAARVGDGGRVVKTAPTSTTSMTGCARPSCGGRACARRREGSRSARVEQASARRRGWTRRPGGCGVVGGCHAEPFRERTEGEHREEGQADDDERHAR